MKSTTKTLTEGPLAKQILLVSLPLALSNLLQVLFNMSDVAVVGRFAGSTALGAVGSTSILVTLFTGFLIGLSNGINVLVARFYGARHTADVQKTVHSAAIVSLIAGVALLFVGLLGSPFMLRLLNTKDDLLPGAILYLRVYFLGMPALALYNFGNAVFSSIGDTKKPLIYLSLAGALNIVLNLFFVIVCRLSVVGVALASAISQCVSAALILRALTRAQDCYALDVHQLHLDPATTKSILALGVPAGFQNAIFAIANLFIQAGVNSFDSLMVKGNSAAANADNMNKMIMQDKAKKAQMAAEKAEAQAIAEKLKGVMVKIPAKAGTGGRLFGAVTSKEISEALQAQFDLTIAKSKIVQEEPIKSFGTYQLKCKLGYEIIGTVNVVVTEET